jgi:cell division protease FtsH
MPLSVPKHERTLRTEASMRGDLIMRLAGRAAEQVILGSVSSGAVDDIDRATDLCRDMVMRMGMGERTGLMSQPRSPDPSSLPESVRADMKAMLDGAYALAVEMVEGHREWLERHRLALRDRDTLDHDTLREGLLIAA